jgi:hypothetical protein
MSFQLAASQVTADLETDLEAQIGRSSTPLRSPPTSLARNRLGTPETDWLLTESGIGLYVITELQSE